jgi:phospholipase/lecithinase/hemolysin
MKQILNRRSVLRVFTAVAAALLIAACGDDNDDDQPKVETVVSFGDSLSDLGTHRWGAVEAVGGGRYTTNPGPIWVEEVATSFGVAIDRNRTGGAGNPSPQQLGGLGYAEGGARVAQLPGVGQNPSGISGIPVESTALPVRQQISAHLQRGPIPGSQLVLVWAGANDIFFQLGVFNQAVGIGIPQETALKTTVDAVVRAAGELAVDIKLLAAAGAERIVVLDAPDVALTPFGSKAPDAARLVMTTLVQTFNQTLGAGLADVAGVVRVDTSSRFREIRANPSAFGLTNVDSPACVLTPQQTSSLYCTASNLVAPDAASRYLFADDIHPTTAGHSQIAELVLQKLKEAD